MASERRIKRTHTLRAETPIGHDEVLAGLWGAAQRDRMPHALLFEGPDGVGKYLAAEHFVRGLACESGPGTPCGTCGPCKRLVSGNYGDLHVLDIRALGYNEIKICYLTLRDTEPARKEMDDIHDNVNEFLALRPAEGGWRVVMIRDAHLANENAQNALLKNLEEPGERTLLILVTSRGDRLLPTIRSRCVRFQFGGIPQADCESIVRDKGLAAEPAATLSRWSEGAPGRALELQLRCAPAILESVFAVLSGELSPLVGARAVAEVDGEYLGSTDSAKARHRAQVAVDLALRVVENRLRISVGVAPDGLAFGVELDAAPVGPRAEARVRVCVDDLLTARQDVERSMNADGILDRCFLALGRLAPARQSAPVKRRGR